MTTAGADAFGLRSVEELLAFLRRWPLSFYDEPFMASYEHLLKPEHEELLLAIFDNEGSSAATLRLVAARSSHIELPLPVFNQLVRLRLRVLCSSADVPAPAYNTVNAYTRILVMLSRDAAEAGQRYILCPMCTAKANAGFAVDPICQQGSMQLRESGQGWLTTNVSFVLCSVAQLLRGRKQDESERIARKLDRAKAAMIASQAGEAPAAGRKCESPACSAREPFAGAFKLCGKCRAVPYCCLACQTADWKRHKRSNCATREPKAVPVAEA